MWPASDSHPTHNRLNGFDPGEGIAPGESWSFTFTQAGVWDLHNHLAPRFLGRVLVVGALGESTESCLAIHTDGTRPQCWEADLQTELKRNGLDAAFSLFEKLYAESDDFKENCHDVMHVLGKAAYHDYRARGDVQSRESTRFCGYGFYHGFTETMLFEEGLNNLEPAHRYCTALHFSDTFPNKTAAWNASQACYHGIGHALFDSLDSSTWGDPKKMVAVVAPQCESLSANVERRVACMSGVFNSLANAMTASNYNLTFNQSDPLRVCREQRPEYHIKCYIEVGVGFLNHNKIPTPESYVFLRTIPNLQARLATERAYIDNEVRQPQRQSTPQSLRSWCESLHDKQERYTCINGLVFGMAFQGKPGEEHLAAFSFCREFAGDNRRYCLSRARDTLNLLMQPPDIHAFCLQLAQDEQPICLKEKEYITDVESELAYPSTPEQR
jgi:hypothetical protein